MSRRLAVRNGRRLPSRSCSLSPAIQTDGSVRTSVRLSNDTRNGPGRISVVPVGACVLLKTIAKALPLARRLALHIEKVRRMRHRLEHDDELRGQLQRHQRFFAGCEFDGIERDLLDHLVQAVGLGQIDAGAPEYLPEILHERQRVRIVRRDAAHRADSTVNVTSTISSSVGS